MENIASNGVGEYGGVKLCDLVGRLKSILPAQQSRKGYINWSSERGGLEDVTFGRYTYSEKMYLWQSLKIRSQVLEMAALRQ